MVAKLKKQDEFSRYSRLQEEIADAPRQWLITGVAGFIGSHLLEALLKLGQHVRGVDNFSTGDNENLLKVKEVVTEEQWSRFEFLEADIAELSTCRASVRGVDHVLHQAALGSVPRSVSDPIGTNLANITGFLNVIDAAKNERVKSFTYAASSSTYGDHEALPKVEGVIGRPMSPYAVTKYVNELYADVYSRIYDFNCIGLRYFNVFGPRQNKNGPYAAVIPKWIDSMLNNEPVLINGDGCNSRDFCYIANVVQANILAAFSKPAAKNNVYNIAVGEQNSLLELESLLRSNFAAKHIPTRSNLSFGPERAGDVKHSLASIEKAASLLGYRPSHSFERGICETVDWYLGRSSLGL